VNHHCIQLADYPIIITFYSHCNPIVGVPEVQKKYGQKISHQIASKSPLLVGGMPTPLKNISQLGRIIPYIMENKTCSKPPISHYNHHKITISDGIIITIALAIHKIPP